MSSINQLHNQHLLWRAGFGPSAADIAQLSTISPKDMLNRLFLDSDKMPEPIFLAGNPLDGLVSGIMDAGRIQELTKEQKQQLKMQSREGLKNLNLKWLDEMVNSPAQLREKMAFFWHGHFACRQINIFFQQELLEIIRRNALGNFGDLLIEISQSAAMLSFLNNQQNRRQHPNENFAREVMELFTLGRGHYTENDIREAARAFTGWGFNLKGEFVFRRIFHDDGEKSFLGKTGKFDGKDILNILLEEKQTARFIAGKIYRFFVNQSPDEERINWLANRFYQGQYEISGLLKDIFLSDWFYRPENIGTRIKSPVELIAGIRRMVPMDIQQPQVQLLYQHLLGQVLFYPPNVAGWPGGKNWIDSSSLMFRFLVPQLLLRNEITSLRPKKDDDVLMGMEEIHAMNLPEEVMEQRFRDKLKKERHSGAEIERRMERYRIRQTGRAANGIAEKPVAGLNRNLPMAKPDWQAFTRYFDKTADRDLAIQMAALLLQSGTVYTELLNRNTNGLPRREYMQELTLRLMRTPEYQLC